MGMRKVKKVEYQKAVRTFTDRMPLREAFKKKYEYAKVNLHEDVGPCVLSFYGIGGIGKTSLLCTLAKEFKAENPNAMCVYHNIEHDTTATPIEILKRLREKISSDYNFSFNFFDWGYYCYENKIGENIEKPEISSFIGKSKFLSYVTEVAKDAPLVGTIAIVLDAVDKGQAMLRDFLKEGKNEFTEMENMEQNMLYEKLPYWFAMDMERNLEKSTVPFVFFIDTYEKHVNELNSTGNALKADLWLRNEDGPIRNISKAMWVISGREKLKWNDTASQITTYGWEEADENNLEQHLVGALSESDSCLFLSNCNIDNGELRKAIYKLTGGIPVYLDLCVTQYENLMSRGKSPAIDDFGNDIQCLIDRIIQYMNDEEQQMVYILSCLKKWDYDLFINVAKAFGMSIMNNKYDALMSMSFINEDSNEKDYHYIDRVVRELLFKKCNERTKKTALKAAIDYCLEHREEKPVFYASMMVQYAVDYYEDNEALNDFYEANLQTFLLDLTEQGKESAEKAYEIFMPFSERADKNENGELYLNKLKFHFCICDMYGEFDKALYYAKQATELSSELYGEYSTSLLSNLAIAYFNLGKYKEAFELQKAVLEKEKAVLGENHSSVLVSMNNIANTYVKLGKYEEALKLHSEVFEKEKNVLGENHPDTLGSMNNLANTYFSLGRYEEALKLYSEVFEKRKVVLDEKHPDTLGSMDNLVITYSKLGRYKEAFELCKETLEMRKAILGENHPYTLTSMSNLANLHSDLGEYKEALELHQKTLNKRRIALGENHPDALGSMNNLANVYSYLGKYEEALKLHSEVLEKRKVILGENHPDVLASIYNLASTYSDLGSYEEAIEPIKELLEKEKVVFNENSDRTLRLTEKFADKCFELGKFKEAAEYYNSFLGENDPNTLISINCLSDKYFELNKQEEAFKLKKYVVEKQKSILNENTREALTLMHNLAATYCELYKYKDAIELFEEVLAKEKIILGENDSATLTTMNNLAATYCKLDKYKDAIELFEEVLAKRKIILGENDSGTLATMYNLASVYFLLAKYEDALAVFKELHIKSVDVYGKENEFTKEIEDKICEIENITQN